MKKVLFFILSLLGLNTCVSAQDKKYTDIDVVEFAKFVVNDSVQLVDVRTPKEYTEGHIGHAKNLNALDTNFIDEAVKSLDSTRPVAVYCRSGKRSIDAARKLSEKGFKVINLKGGMLSWKAQHLPINQND